MTSLFNVPEGKARRRELRKAAVGTEQQMWRLLRARQLAGARFRRQYGVGPYIVDFYCPAAHLAVEIDGAGHYEGDGPARDAARTAYLCSCGIRVVRFSNVEVLENEDGVLEAIAEALAAGPPG